MARARIRPLMLLPPVLFLAVVGLFALGNIREDRDALPSALVGTPAPAMALGELPGHPGFDQAALRDGEVALVNFWASWCPPCRAEMPFFAELAAEGVTIFGVNARDEQRNALAFLDELGNPFAGIGTSDGRAAIDWGVYGMPETFVVDGDGTILLRHPGEITPQVWETRIRPVLERARGG